MSTAQDHNPSAFPKDAISGGHLGMSLRDWFAGQALAGFLADPNCGSDMKGTASYCYQVADAMLDQRGTT
jgi:hypothetical protein